MCVRVGVWGVCGCVCVCGCGMLICFVSALGSHEMGHHKLPIIIIIMHSLTFITIMVSEKIPKLKFLTNPDTSLTKYM